MSKNNEINEEMIIHSEDDGKLYFAFREKDN